jgi:hypothetical protein
MGSGLVALKKLSDLRQNRIMEGIELARAPKPEFTRPPHKEPRALESQSVLSVAGPRNHKNIPTRLASSVT